MVQYVITRQRKLFAVEGVKPNGSRKIIGQFATEQEAVSLRRSLQDQADAAEIHKAVLAPD